MFNLDRFKIAQDQGAGGFSTALAELRAGQKRSHWIWYIFPQLAGLGHSAMAVRYGLHGEAEATDYLRDPVLRERLLAATDTVATQLRRRPAPALVDLMGAEVDVLKLVSCITLFREVSRRATQLEPLPGYREFADNAGAILGIASRQGFPECRSTLRQLASSG